MNPQYKRKGKTRAEILKENPDAFKKLSKKEVKELRKNKKELSTFAMKGLKQKLKDLSIDDIAKIAEALDRIEKKIDLALNISRPQYTDIKGYPAKSLKEKISFFWTKGNSE